MVVLFIQCQILMVSVWFWNMSETKNLMIFINWFSKCNFCDIIPVNPRNWVQGYPKPRLNPVRKHR